MEAWEQRPIGPTGPSGPSGEDVPAAPRPEAPPRARSLAEALVSRRAELVLAAALVLVLGGGALAGYVQTGGGEIEVRDVRFASREGGSLSALLYVPPNATAQSPAPGVLAVHGYINSRETQSPFAIELARRGYVVLALDQPGHGYSDPPAFARAFGGPDGLRYLRSLDEVDPDQIALEGHSMGGWAVLQAAASEPEGYRAIALVGSSTGSFGTPPGTASFPRNLALVFSTWDEFSQLMWGAEVARDVVGTDKLKAQFGTSQAVAVGALYGSIEAGTARVLHAPRTTHPQGHHSWEAIGRVLDWIQRTVPAPTPRPSQDQVWHWKELGTLLALLGALTAVLALADLLLCWRFLAEIRQEPAPVRARARLGWWIGAGLTLALPALTYLELQRLGPLWLPPSSLLPQQLTTGLVVWAVVHAGLVVLGFGLWHVTSGGLREHRGIAYGLRGSRLPWLRGVAKSLLLALLLAGFVHGLLSVSGFLFGTDFRVWVVALKPLDALHARIFARYLVPFAIFFLAAGLVMHAQLRRPWRGFVREAAFNAALLTGGLIVLLAIQYVPLLNGSPLPLGEPLFTILAIQLVPILAATAVVSSYMFRRTGQIYAGAFLNALVITAYTVAGQATHVAI